MCLGALGRRPVHAAPYGLGGPSFGFGALGRFFWGFCRFSGDGLDHPLSTVETIGRIVDGDGGGHPGPRDPISGARPSTPSEKRLRRFLELKAAFARIDASADGRLSLDEFRQADSSYSRRYEGTGLGLALTRKFVEMHRGSIWVESEEKKGSRFSFRLPVSFSPDDADGSMLELSRGGAR